MVDERWLALSGAAVPVPLGRLFKSQRATSVCQANK